MPGSENVSEGGNARGRGRGRARTRGGGARGTRGGAQGRARGARGGATSRPQVYEDLRIGHISELPTRAQMETPLHIKRRRMLPATEDVCSSSSSWSSMPNAPQPQASTSAASGAAEAGTPQGEPAPLPQASTSAVSGAAEAGTPQCEPAPLPQASTSAASGAAEAGTPQGEPAPLPQAYTSAVSGAAEAGTPQHEPAPLPQASTSTAPYGTLGSPLAFVPSPALFIECGNTPSSSSSRQQNPRRLLRDEEIDFFVNYGSEEEEEEDDDDLAFVAPVLRSVRILTEMAEETIEDSPIEAQAAGRIEDADVLEADVAGPTRLFDFEWVPHGATPICPVSRRESFGGQCGPTRGPIASAYEAFVSIWDRSIMDHIVQQTNKYAQDYATHLLETGQMGPCSRINRWCDTNVYELYTYLAIVMAMGILIKARMPTYWNRSADIFQSHGFAAHMSLRRFELLSKCLHFNNNDHLGNLTPPQAKLFKISPIIDHLNDRFQSLYNLSQNIALDESLAQWKGWLNFKQYIPNKAAQVGIKTYEICDSRSGYLWRFEVHAGSHISEGEEVIPVLMNKLLDEDEAGAAVGVGAVVDVGAAGGKMPLPLHRAPRLQQVPVVLPRKAMKKSWNGFACSKGSGGLNCNWVLLPDAPPRKQRAQHPSPERSTCEFVPSPAIAVAVPEPEPLPQPQPEPELVPEPGSEVIIELIDAASSPAAAGPSQNVILPETQESENCQVDASQDFLVKVEEKEDSVPEIPSVPRHVGSS
ncbi:hypothetical protein evm_013748 [Chilo suppressalis]|nr:hypothetical protein evm_013748 [Chilo suppressalis]